MADDEPQCQVVYLDTEEPEETNWIKRAGKAKVTYVNGCTFEGSFDDEKIKQGAGVYVWMGPGEEEDEAPVEKARFEGNYKDGAKEGLGRMTFPSGDIYEGEWKANMMTGEGSYTYKASGDIYSGSFKEGKKHGQGTYEFAKDSSILAGTWEEGQIVSGSWTLKGCAVYEGEFKLGRPIGSGKFNFSSGLSQTGSYEEKPRGEDEEEPAEGEVVAPNVSWKGDTIVSF